MALNASQMSERTKRTRRSAAGTAGSRRDQDCEPAIQAFIPPHLRQFVAPYYGDFCFTSIFDARLISALMAEGFLPIATEGYLLPKLHEQRCVINLDQNALHISKSTRKKSKRYSLTVNTSFDKVIEACRRQHGETCWLYDPLVRSFRAIHMNPDNYGAILNPQTGKVEPCPVRLYSVEVWNEEKVLVAGELGYTVGCIYTSLTGFTVENSAGSIQLAALGCLLLSCGFALWDLGMDMDYKRRLGADLMSRSDFLGLVHRVRLSCNDLKLPSERQQFNCRSLIDQEFTTLNEAS